MRWCTPIRIEIPYDMEGSRPLHWVRWSLTSVKTPEAPLLGTRLTSVSHLLRINVTIRLGPMGVRAMPRVRVCLDGEAPRIGTTSRDPPMRQNPFINDLLARMRMAPDIGGRPKTSLPQNLICGVPQGTWHRHGTVLKPHVSLKYH